MGHMSIYFLCMKIEKWKTSHSSDFCFRLQISSERDTGIRQTVLRFSFSSPFIHNNGGRLTSILLLLFSANSNNLSQNGNINPQRSMGPQSYCSDFHFCSFLLIDFPLTSLFQSDVVSLWHQCRFTFFVFLLPSVPAQISLPILSFIRYISLNFGVWMFMFWLRVSFGLIMVLALSIEVLCDQCWKVYGGFTESMKW